MSAVDITDFEEALQLLGLYQQEVSRTGGFSYAAHWIIDEAPVLPVIPPVPDKTQPLEAELVETTPSHPVSPPVVTSTESATEVSSPQSSSVSNPVNNIEITVPSPVMVCSATCPHRSTQTEMEALVPEPQPALSPAEQRRLEVLAQQEEERQLFYYYVQEIEKTGHLSQLPQVIRPYPKH